MTLPTILIGIVFSTLIGAAYHLIRGGNLGHLLMYILLAWIGFWVGHLIGNRIGWTFFSLGTLRLGMACIGSLITLFIGHWLFVGERKV